MAFDSFLTVEGHKKIKEELEMLRTVAKVQIAEKIRDAREMGDVLENTMYDAYIEDQGRIEGRIAELEEILGRSQVIEIDSLKKSDTASVGHSVKVKFNGKEDSFTLVGSAEADPSEKKISIESPVGKALLGAKVGETIIVETPQIRVEYLVKDIT
ncbi:MAG: transcription elongation factor GreA [Patescibacteria group bacterium]|nr:transcription elongation factor GreA [Patescibacteria group bacterium]